jgi:peptide chain release factor 1
MSAIQIEKLDRIIHRFANVEHELSSGPAGDVFVKLSKEYAELEPTAKAAQNLKQAYTERRDVDDMLKAGGELAAMAEAERETLDA